VGFEPGILVWSKDGEAAGKAVIIGVAAGKAVIVGVDDFSLKIKPYSVGAGVGSSVLV
jgi:hypothetical protein